MSFILSLIKEEIPPSIIDQNVTTKTNHYLKEFVENLSKRVNSSINSFQFINTLQQLAHAYELPSFVLTDDDLFAPSTQKFLGDYSLDEIHLYLDKYGIKKELAKRGYKDIIINLDTSDYFVHQLCVTDKSLYTNSLINGRFLINLFVRKKDFIYSDFKTYQILRRIETFHNEKFKDKQIQKIKYIDGFGASEVYKFMENHLNDRYLLSLIEWICMQDPRGEFSKDKPQFPGQNYPGLRFGRKAGNMLISLAVHKGWDGLSNVPEHFHNAYVYHMQHYTFLNPAFQAYFDCLCDSLADDLRIHGLSAVSWAFCNGHVRNRDDEIEIWNPEEQIYPVSSKLRSYLDSRDYKRLYNIFYKRGYQVSIDWENAKEIWRYSLNNEFNEVAKHFGEDKSEDILHNEMIPSM
ncbi:2018_t:CDS:2 [Funneliformis mosseae]|uniref:2018_t:CDS:1 n=1 Tax=Funneliformis mosseae TaxID=27381 RepID=A0A9N8V1E0_FUNMO|nr:2018_t:CDS:2 [Funneliformis mosseae]